MSSSGKPPAATVLQRSPKEADRLIYDASGRRPGSLSFWDALVVVAAARSSAKVLHTEDLNDGEERLGVRIHDLFGG